MILCWRVGVFASVTACAPVAHLRPASAPAEDDHAEVGAAVATLGPRPYVREDTTATGQLWATTTPDDRLTVSGIVAFDTSAVAAGAAARWNAVRARSFAAGLEGELGFAWAGVSAGAALRPFGEHWLYTAPRFGTLGSRWAVSVPLGVDIAVAGGFRLRGEAQLSWAELRHYNRRAHYAAGVVYRW